MYHEHMHCAHIFFMDYMAIALDSVWNDAMLFKKLMKAMMMIRYDKWPWEPINFYAWLQLNSTLFQPVAVMLLLSIFCIWSFAAANVIPNSKKFIFIFFLENGYRFYLFYRANRGQKFKKEEKIRSLISA